MKYTPHIEALTKLQYDLSQQRNNDNSDVEKVLEMERDILSLLSELYSMRKMSYDKADHRDRHNSFSIVDF